MSYNILITAPLYEYGLILELEMKCLDNMDKKLISDIPSFNCQHEQGPQR